MAESENKNKRVIVGLIIFAVLILINIINYSARSKKQKAKHAKINSKVINNVEVNSNKVSSAKTANLTLPLRNNLNPSDINVKEQFELTKKILSGLEKKLSEIPVPEEEPQYPSALMLSRKKLFQWDVELTPPERPVATEPSIVAETVATDSYEVIGNFTVKGKKKIWVKKGSKVYVMNGEGTPEKEKLFLLSYAGNDFKIIDETGKDRDISFVNKDHDRIEKIVNYLKTGNDQTIYETIADEDKDKKGEK